MLANNRSLLAAALSLYLLVLMRRRNRRRRYDDSDLSDLSDSSEYEESEAEETDATDSDLESDSDTNEQTYKHCIVTKCWNTTTSTPDKYFFPVPTNLTERENWGRAIQRQDIKLYPSSLYCCEDHFDLPKDVENYEDYKTGRTKIMNLINKTVPTKSLGLQTKGNPGPSTSQSGARKRQSVSVQENNKKRRTSTLEVKESTTEIISKIKKEIEDESAIQDTVKVEPEYVTMDDIVGEDGIKTEIDIGETVLI